MKHFTNNYLYLQNRDEFFGNDAHKHTVSAVITIMHITSVYRLFTKQDVCELIMRLAIALKGEALIDKYFSEDVLFSYEHEEAKHDFTVKDLENFIGFENFDGIQNFQPREWWIENRAQNWKNALLGSIFSGGNAKLFKPETSQELLKGDDELTTTVYIKAPEHTKTPPTDKEKEHAEFLANSIIKELGDTPFNWLLENHPVKFKELEMRQNTEEIPDFNFESIPLELQQAIWKHWWPELQHFDDPDERDFIGKHARLAYFWANGFVWDSHGYKKGDLWGMGYYDERLDIDIEDYQVRDDYGCYNLVQTYTIEDLQELFPLLYDPEVEKFSERPWEKMMHDAYFK